MPKKHKRMTLRRKRESQVRHSRGGGNPSGGSHCPTSGLKIDSSVCIVRQARLDTCYGCQYYTG